MIPSRLSMACGPHRSRMLGMALLVIGLAGCGGSSAEAPPVIVTATHANVVSYWNDIANKTVNAGVAIPTAAPTTAPPTIPATPATAEERRPSYHVDLATVHVAIYDAVSAIDGRYQPFAITATAASPDASIDAAASAAAYGVLRALFPNRGAQYQGAYDSRVATIPDGDAKTRGLAVGSEVAAAVVALRASDGRGVVLAPYVSSATPGKFRSANPTPFNRYVPFIKTFSLTSIDQFRPPPPPALDSPAYAAAFNESKAGGGTLSATRTPEQFETVRFHTDVPALFVTRNLGRFASSTSDVAEAARLMAFLYVVHADAIGACFEAKYFYEFWRPLSAIPRADDDGNPATTSDAAWTPVVPSPNHPEYPAAHSCAFGAFGETLRQYYGTRQVTYTLDSAVTATTRTYASTDALNDESHVARVFGGMHFAFSTLAGVELGSRVAQWVGAHHFGRRQ